MSLIENYGEPRLITAEWPDHHQPHRCGTAPFVPVADAPRQHSCGSYKAGFGPNGCNKYRPNYPDDLYIQTHGCEGLADCKDGVPPKGHVGYEGTRISCGVKPEGEWHRAWGYKAPSTGPHGCAVEPPASVIEGFVGGLPDLSSGFGLLFWVVIACLAYKFLVNRKK